MQLYTVGQVKAIAEGITWERIGTTLDRQHYLIRTKTGKILYVGCQGVDSPKGELIQVKSDKISVGSRKIESRKGIVKMFDILQNELFTVSDVIIPFQAINPYIKSGLIEVAAMQVKKTGNGHHKYHANVYRFVKDARERVPVRERRTRTCGEITMSRGYSEAMRGCLAQIGRLFWDAPFSVSDLDEVHRYSIGYVQRCGFVKKTDMQQYALTTAGIRYIKLQHLLED